MPQSYAALYYHVIFSTRDRAPLIDPQWRPRLQEYLGGVVRNRDGHLLAAGGMPDHMHLLTTLSREQAISDALRDIKALTSKWIHEELGFSDFAWQAGYGAFTVSSSALDSVQRYIARQEEHHRKMTYQEEFVAFLERHHVEFDTRYLWE